MALCRPRVASGVLGGLIAALTLQGCFEEAVNGIIEHTCSMQSGEYFDGMKKTLIEKALEGCLELSGNDTQINGKDCESEIAERFSQELVDDQDNFTKECTSSLTAKYEELSNRSSALNPSELATFVSDLVTSFFDERQSQLDDIKNGLIDQVTDSLDELKDGDSTTTAAVTNSTTNSTTEAVTPGRLYVVADAYKRAGAPRFAIGGPLAMIAAGALAIAVAAGSCSRRRGFQVVGGDEQAADGSAQHA